MRAAHIIGFEGLSWIGHGPADERTMQSRIRPETQIWIGPERSTVEAAIADAWRLRVKLAERLGRRDEAGWYAIPFAEAVELALDGRQPSPPVATPPANTISTAMDVFGATQAEVAYLIGTTPAKVSRTINQGIGDVSLAQFERLRWWAHKLNLQDHFDSAFGVDNLTAGPRRPQLTLVAGTQQ